MCSGDAMGPTPIALLPPSCLASLESFAAHFYNTGQFESLFINRLVPWDELAGEPNGAHAAAADLLLTRAANFALTSNFDCLVEHWANARKVSMRGALSGTQAEQERQSNSPLVKFHGCMNRCREKTYWTQAQDEDQEVKQRIESCTKWMASAMPGKVSTPVEISPFRRSKNPPPRTPQRRLSEAPAGADPSAAWRRVLGVAEAGASESLGSASRAGTNPALRLSLSR